jgi:hypothetical protein
MIISIFVVLHTTAHTFIPTFDIRCQTIDRMFGLRCSVSLFTCIHTSAQKMIAAEGSEHIHIPHFRFANIGFVHVRSYNFCERELEFWVIFSSYTYKASNGKVDEWGRIWKKAVFA